MQLCQMLVQGMWINESPLLQILDRQTVRILNENYEIKEISEFVDMDDDKRRNVLRGKDIDKIAAACNRYPVMNLQCKLGEKNEEEIELRVSLDR